MFIILITINSKVFLFTEFYLYDEILIYTKILQGGVVDLSILDLVRVHYSGVTVVFSGLSYRLWKNKKFDFFMYREKYNRRQNL